MFLLMAVEPRKIPIVIGLFSNLEHAKLEAMHLKKNYDARYIILKVDEVEGGYDGNEGFD